MYIIATPNKDQQVYQKKISMFSPKDAFYQRKRREKRFREFSAGHGFFIDPVAIQVSLSPNWAVLARFFPLDERDCMGEFVNKGI